MEDVSINTALGRMRYALINMRKLIASNNIVMEY
jgi:RNA polymerase sigma-70 factor, ECF subfamily